jgi:iron complex outermembrane recepter protein
MASSLAPSPEFKLWGLRSRHQCLLEESGRGHLKSNESIRRAVIAILSASAAGSYGIRATAADAAASASSGGLEEIVVTATRRSENLQNVPITIQALTSDTLEKLNVETFDDMVKYLPNVTTQNLSPGQGNIYLRGLAVGTLATQGQGSVGFFPTVAVYLDDQSTSLPDRNLDVYAADLERVEVLEGPQGTLFGAGAEAGVVRYITNKPKLNVTEGSANGAISATAHGDPNTSFDAMINLPVIPDRLAVRAVAYNDSRGGYIDNVPSTFTRQATDASFVGYKAALPINTVQINNYQSVKQNQNPVTYKGMRLSVLGKFNDEWDALLTESYQTIDAEGVFYQNPKGSDGQTLAPLQVTTFTPSFDKDRFSNTAWTINGKFGDLKFVYTGGYLNRHHDASQDYTNYARGNNAIYYQCAGYNKIGGGTCYSPASVATDTENNTVWSHEMRLSTPDDWRLRGLVGAFYQDQKIEDWTQWLYRSVPTCSPTGLTSECYLPIAPWPGSPFVPPGGIYNPDVGFTDDFARELKQTALFVSIDAELIPKTLTLTLGTRWFDIKNNQSGGDVGSFYCKVFAKPTTSFAPCAAPYGTNFATQSITSNDAKGFKSRVNLTWNVTDAAMVYATWSQGYRPGGFNRGTSCHVADPVTKLNEWCNSLTYASDSLINYELGWKSEWLNRRLQVNGSIYEEKWKDVQTGIFAPATLGNLTLGFNGPEYRIRGLELQVIGRVTDGLTVQAAASWNSSTLVNSPYLIINNPALAGTASAGLLGTPLTAVPNPYGVPGSPTASSPPFQGNLRVRYEFNFNDYHAFWQVGLQHSAHSYSSATALNLYDQPQWTTFDASIGVSKGSWRIEAFGQNLTDLNKSLFTSNTQYIVTETPIRPRVLGLRFGYKFSE